MESDVIKQKFSSIVKKWHLLSLYFGLQAINSLKNVDSTALLQFLHPILNMLLHLIGNGGETLQVLSLVLIMILLSQTCTFCVYALFHLNLQAQRVL